MQSSLPAPHLEQSGMKSHEEAKYRRHKRVRLANGLEPAISGSRKVSLPPAMSEQLEADEQQLPSDGGAQTSEYDQSKHWLKAWSWKREHRPDKVRFHKPYRYPLAPTASLQPNNAIDMDEGYLTIHQAPFNAEGFASTVWDSSIVLSKYLEKQPMTIRGKHCLDLSAGCGLVGIVMSRLGGIVTCTDLEPNLPLLRKNCEENGEDTITVQEHQWGDTFPQQHSNTAPPPFDIVAACDVMYIREAVPQLVSSLCKCVKRPHGKSFVAHGRNRNGESEFVAAVMEEGLCVRELNGSDLDAVYQCIDVLRLLLHGQMKVIGCFFKGPPLDEEN